MLRLKTAWRARRAARGGHVAIEGSEMSTVVATVSNSSESPPDTMPSALDSSQSNGDETNRAEDIESHGVNQN